MTYLLALSSLLSRLLGVYRNHALAQLFGAGELSDAYFAAFQIPDILYRLLVFGAISASFVPLFLKLRKKRVEDAWDFVVSITNGFIVCVFIISAIIFFFSQGFVEVLYPSFTHPLQVRTAELLRIMLLSPLLFTFSSIFSGIQNAFRSFWGFALAPLLYNGGIIYGILVLSPIYGIVGVAYGVILGAFLHAFIQLVPSIFLGWRWRLAFYWTKELRMLLLSGIPRMLSMASFQLNFFIEGVIATTIFTGNLTVLRYAQDLQSFPIGIVGVSMAISSFSIVSHYVIDKKPAELSSYIQKKLNHIFLLIIPAAFGLYVLRIPIIRLVLAGGVFDQMAVDFTAQTLAYLCIGISAAAITPFITRVFFAFHDTMWPFLVSIGTVLVNTLLALYWSGQLGIAGIGLASSTSLTISIISLLLILRWKHLRTDSFISFKHLFIFIFSGVVMMISIQHLIAIIGVASSGIILFWQIMLYIIVGAVIYMAITFLFLRKDLFRLIKSLGH